MTLTRDLEIGPIRDVGLLESAAHRPRTSVWGHETYPDLEMKAAVLLESLVRHYPLVDGNKRLGWVSAVVFLDVNGRWLETDDDEAYELVIGVADESISAEAVGQAFRRWCGDGWSGRHLKDRTPRMLRRRSEPKGRAKTRPAGVRG